MVIYEITAKVRTDLIEDFERFMKETHIPDLLKTGYFENGEIALLTSGNYRIRYSVKDRKTLETYFEKDAEILRKNFVEKFPEGVEVSREILEE